MLSPSALSPSPSAGSQSLATSAKPSSSCQKIKVEEKGKKKKMKEEKGKKKIKKIDNKAARQVAFSKRRRGLFSKAEQLSQLCDAKVAAIIFSTAGRPYSYSSSSMKDIIAKYEMISKKSLKQDDRESELLNKQYGMLCEEVAKKSHDLRQLKGDGLEGLEIEQLQSLEDRIGTTLKQLRKTMEENFFMAEIKTLRQKQAELLQENDKLRKMIMMISQKEGALRLQEVGQANSLPNNDSSVTLKLGLPSSDEY